MRLHQLTSSFLSQILFDMMLFCFDRSSENKTRAGRLASSLMLWDCHWHPLPSFAAACAPEHSGCQTTWRHGLTACSPWYGDESPRELWCSPETPQEPQPLLGFLEDTVDDERRWEGALDVKKSTVSINEPLMEQDCVALTFRERLLSQHHMVISSTSLL